MNEQNQGWANLVGLDGNVALETIRNQDASLNVVIVGENKPVTRDYRFDRVRIFVNENNIVVREPRTG